MKTVLILSTLPLTTLLSLIWGKYAIQWLQRLKLGQHIREEGPKSHYSKGGTPTMGGIIFLLPMLLVSFFFSTPNLHTLVILGTVVLIAGVGFIDDFQKIYLKNNKGITPKQKLAGQILIGALLAAYYQFGPPQHLPYTELPFTGWQLPLSFLFIPFITFFFTATTNAVNLTDGLDGLATTVSIGVIGTLTAMLAMQGNTDDPAIQTLLVLGLSTVGGCLGFLWYNAHPAQVFMGDTGSLGLGGIVSVIALAGHLELWFVLVGLIYVLEALSVVIQVIYYKRTKKRFFRMSPLHHHFELGGWKETQVVQRFGIITLICASAALTGFYAVHGIS